MKTIKIILGVICLFPAVVLISAFVWLVISRIATFYGWPFALIFFPGILVVVAGLYKGMEILSDL